MSTTPRSEEEKYFHDEDVRKLAELRGEADAEKKEKERWKAIADAVGSKDLQVGKTLDSLGFSPDSARVLFFIPLIEVAWADGKIGYEESYKIIDQARRSGIRATTEAFEFLSSLTLRKPEDRFFEECNGIIRKILAERPAGERESKVVSLTQLVIEVARASRGFFGFGKDITDDEKVAIEDIVADLGLEESPRVKEMLEKL